MPDRLTMIFSSQQLLTQHPPYQASNHDFFRFSSFVRTGCWHFLNCKCPSQVCLFLIWKSMLIHFCLSSRGSPLQDAQHHQKWFITILIHIPSFSQSLLLLALNNAFLCFFLHVKHQTGARYQGAL